MVRKVQISAENFMQEKLRAALKAIQGVKIPDLPKEIMELDQALGSRFPNNQHITEIIESNTKLSGEVLRIVNSPAMKAKTPINSIRKAVDTLGSNNLKNLVLSACLQNLSKTPPVVDIIEHSKDVAYCCAELSEVVHDVSRDEAYLAGLFHNGGCLMLATKDPNNYLKVFSKLNTNAQQGVEREQELYGSNHMFVGILLGQKWKLPVNLLNIIMKHHSPLSSLQNDKLRSMVAMMTLANFIVNEVAYGAYITEQAQNEFNEAQAELMISSAQINLVRNALLSSG
ncbi:HDOD domain-containing protein [Thiosulfativibrio zosterae]|uniref:Metal-dependent phosphohydrolase n=1 Tax=Thiosulfativibrio zosterae TaxID=2675053 RepID=A0A6F8PKF8_9GAMM|nr:HDOD domain-containing protein [Thiosulfativibrio zosterae]BBP42558.1 metal-dependent phosphohydrolase [Thiosulfativibrio zosterae]